MTSSGDSAGVGGRVDGLDLPGAPAALTVAPTARAAVGISELARTAGTAAAVALDEADGLDSVEHRFDYRARERRMGFFAEGWLLILVGAIAVGLAGLWQRYYLDCGLWPQAGQPYCAYLGNPRFIWDPSFLEPGVLLADLVAAFVVGLVLGIGCLWIVMRWLDLHRQRT